MATKPNVLRPYKSVPVFLKSMRLSARLTQLELAKRIRKKQYFIARIESGARRLDVSEFIILAEACGKEAGAAIRQLKKHIGT